MKKYIASRPNIMGGAPVLVGTRVPIAVIVSLLKQGYTIKEIDKMYPWVGFKKLEGAVDELVNRLADKDEAQTILQA